MLKLKFTVIGTTVIAIATALIGSLLAALAFTPASAVGESSGGVFVPVTPFRAGEVTMSGGTFETFQIRGQGGIPTTGVSAVVVDIAATSSTATSSYLTAWPAGETRPGYGTMFFNKDNAPRSNTAIVKLGSGTGNGGKISVYNNSGTSKVYIDVQGYFTAASDENSAGGFVPITPTRVMNSANGFGTSATGPVPNGASRIVQVTNGDSIADEATSVFANIEVRDATGPGILQVGAGDVDLVGRPGSMNYGDNGVYTTGMTIPLDSAGKLRIRNVGVAANVKIDIQGYFSGDPSAGGSFHPVNAANAYSTGWESQAKLGAGETRTVRMAGAGPFPDELGLAAVSLTVTARNWTSGGTVSLWNPDDEVENTPGTTNVAFTGTNGVPSNGVSSSAIVGVSVNGEVSLHNSSSNPVDVTLVGSGWFSLPEEEVEPVAIGDFEPQTVASSTATHTRYFPVTLVQGEFLATVNDRVVLGDEGSPELGVFSSLVADGNGEAVAATLSLDGSDRLKVSIPTGAHEYPLTVLADFTPTVPTSDPVADEQEDDAAAEAGSTPEGVASAASYVRAGCKTRKFKQKYGIPTFYGAEYSLRWCWTAGTNPRNKSIRGAIYTWENFIYDTKNAVGPANSARIPISSSWVDSNGRTRVYFWFQSRGCASAKAGVACTSWKWHRLKYRIYAGGGYTVLSRS